MTPPDPTRLLRALKSLEGLSVGDGFGEQFFLRPARVLTRELPPGPWRWTDDTHMALSVVETLMGHGEIEQDDLIARFARRYRQDPRRGYGPGMHKLLPQARLGRGWRQHSSALFHGSGSYGNGAAMRVAPLGAWFADDPALAARQAALSAEVTHTHPEGQAGAVVVAVASALAHGPSPPTGAAFLQEIIALTPVGLVREGLERALELPPEALREAIEALGTGQRVSAQDTAPFCAWVAAHHQGDFVEAMWATVSGMGDRDTTCAIVGGIVATEAAPIPQEWLAAREPLPTFES